MMRFKSILIIKVKHIKTISLVGLSKKDYERVAIAIEIYIQIKG